MKTILTLIISVIAVMGATAQMKLWTWKGKWIDGCRSVKAIAMSGDGGGAFVLQETKLNDKPSFLLVWVDRKGNVVMSRKMALIDYRTNYTTAESQQWELTFTGPGKLIASNGETVQMFRVGAGGAEFVKAMPQKNAMVFGSASFGGWVDISQPTYKIQGTPAEGLPGWPGYVGATPPKGMIQAESLTAWRF